MSIYAWQCKVKKWFGNFWPPIPLVFRSSLTPSQFNNIFEIYNNFDKEYANC